MIAPLFESSVYRNRRKKLLSTLRPNIDLIVLFTHTLKTRTYDTDYDFRGHSSFLYYTGFPEPEGAAILRNLGKSTSYKEDFGLFVRPRDPHHEHWEGKRFGPEGAKKYFHANRADEYANLEAGILAALSEVTPGMAPRIYTNAFHDPHLEEFLLKVIRKHRKRIRRVERAVEAIYDVEHLARAQRAIKGPEEIKIMREAGRINVEAHKKIMKALRPGLYEYEVQAIGEGDFLANGCRSPAYGSIVASGAGATVLHYHENNRRMKDGELLLVDMGCEFEGYASDITRTLPVNGQYTPAQRSIMDLVAEAHKEGIELSREGNSMEKIHKNTERCLAEGLRTLKLVKGTLKQILDQKLHTRYFTHGTGHWLGLDTHDPNPYYDEKGVAIKLKAGMIFTVEPGLYFQPSDKTVPAEYKGIGIRIEDNVLVTRSKPDVLTEGLPRYADEIEKFMKRNKASKAN